MVSNAGADMDAVLHAGTVDRDGVPHAHAMCGVWVCADRESEGRVHGFLAAGNAGIWNPIGVVAGDIAVESQGS